MNVPDSLPGWGGALGQLVDAIKNVAQAIDNSTANDETISVQHGGSGELLIGSGRSNGGSGSDTGDVDLPGGYVDVVTDVDVDFSVEGATMKVKLTLHKSRITLEADGTLSEESIGTDEVEDTVTGEACEDAGGGE